MTKHPPPTFQVQLLDQADIAQHLRITQRTLRRWQRRGLLPQPAVAQAGTSRWRLQDLQSRFPGVFA